MAEVDRLNCGGTVGSFRLRMIDLLEVDCDFDTTGAAQDCLNGDPVGTCLSRIH